MRSNETGGHVAAGKNKRARHSLFLTLVFM